MRTCFQRDRDRIVHSKAFRRLKGKTQVFFAPAGDHFRTRLTHTLEVSQIARTISRALLLNEDLTEAIALGHDLGHTPFGHTGEDVLGPVLAGGFHHARQSLRVVDVIEKDGRGLNATLEVRDGILRHTKGGGEIAHTGGEDSPGTLEGEVVRFSDVIAYLNHDLDDALRAGLLSPADLPVTVAAHMGRTHGERIHRLVLGILGSTEPGVSAHVAMDPDLYAAMNDLREFMYARVYLHPDVTREMDRARGILRRLWDALVGSEALRAEIMGPKALDQDVPRSVADFIAGMTDAYAVDLHDRLFVPRRWFHT